MKDIDDARLVRATKMKKRGEFTTEPGVKIIAVYDLNAPGFGLPMKHTVTRKTKRNTVFNMPNASSWENDVWVLCLD